MSCIMALLLTCSLADVLATGGDKFFRITVVDDQTGRGVPLVELQTVNNIRYYTDSNGIVAFHEPGLMDQKVFFYVKSHGYDFPKDGFGFHGTALDVTEGGAATLKIKRLNIAERLYRVTGAGIYRDSILVGHPVPLRRPLLNGLVFGSDSVMTTFYRGKVHWFWGDTNRPSYPLGLFQMSGATSLLPADGGLDPEVGVDLTYFVDDTGFAKAMSPMPGSQPAWLDGFIVLPGESGRERMFAAYARVRPNMEAYERGWVEFNDEKRQFENAIQFDLDAPVRPGGHPFKLACQGVEYVYFPHPFPLVRVRADVHDLTDLARYEAFTCLREGSRLESPEIDRTPAGTVRYAWRRNAPPLSPQMQAKLIEAGHLKAGEVLLHLQDVDTGKPVLPHSGSVYWNAYRGRWITIRCESFGTSMLGETWYAEADTPLGPWVYARKIVTHDKYSFYNPKQHPMFDKDGGRIILFEGTYTHTFSGNPDQTPRYDYNQIMYKLDLSDKRLVLPVPVYRLQHGSRRFATLSRLPPGGEAQPIAFFAPDRPGPRTVPIVEGQDQGGETLLAVAAAPRSAGDRRRVPVFHALPLDIEERPPTTVPLYEFAHDDGRPRVYTTDASWSASGYKKSKRPVCRVWRNPLHLAFPADSM